MPAPAIAALPLPRRRKRDFVAVVIGNGLEFYDFIAYAFFALQISHTFFPASTPGTSLLLSLATFGAGFLMRPLGAAVLGRFADIHGRRPAMLVSFTLMGIGMVGLALTPSYGSIGLAAPLLVIAWRLLQGFSVGGEVGPSLAYLVEAAPPERRGLYSSLQPMTADAAACCAGLVGLTLSSLLTPERLDVFGWRIAFLLGAAIVPVGLILRRALPETLTQAEPLPTADGCASSYRRVAVLGFGMLASGTVIGYVQDYFTTYAADTLGMSPQLAFAATLVSAFSMMCCDPLGGWLSDRFGRKPIMIVPWLFLAVAVFPSFWLLERLRTAGALYGACAVLGSISTLSSATIIVAITESLPPRQRSTGIALTYALAISVFGGSTQFLVAWLIQVTGNPLAPAWYMFCGVIIGLVALSQLPETAPVRTDAAGAGRRSAD